MNILKLQAITTLFVVLTAGQVFADAVCDECMDERVKGQTVVLNSSVSSDTIKVANKVDPFSPQVLADLCESVRYLKTSKVDDNFYEFEYQMFKLAGINDPDNTSDEELKSKLSTIWKKHSKDFQCSMATNIYPVGNYLRQLARADGEDAFELVLDNYGFDPNIIDKDGCTALDYLNAQIKAVNDYSYILIEKFKKYKKILLKYDAKSANELGGKC